MLVYRMIVQNEYDNLGRIKEKEWFGPNYPNNDDFYYVSNSNTFRKNMKNGQYFYFYAEDAIRKTQIFEEEWMHNRRKIHIAEFDISIEILAEYFGLGIYRNYHDRNLSNDPYYIALEFAIPYKVITDAYRDENYRHSCITGKLYPVAFFEHFEEVKVSEDVSRESYRYFALEQLPIILEMLNVGILPPEKNYEGKNKVYGFSKLADDYSREDAIKILTKLNR